ncbi:MAG TPA: flippase [Cyclobacteriaceae bacterium]|nr:flippase [Cyclobacteriaceae bacterium]
MTQFNIKKWIKPGLYTTLDKFSVVFLGFVNFFILSRVLSKSDFGVWVLFTGLVSVLETLREGFIKQPLIALMPTQHDTERDRVGSAALTLNWGYSILISILLFVTSATLEVFWDAYPLATLLQIYGFVNLIFVLFSHYEYLQQTVLDFKGIFVGHLVRSLIPTLFILACISAGIELTLIKLVYSVLAGNIIGLIFMMYFGWKHRHQYLLPKINELQSMLSFGKFSLGTNIASLSIRNMDSWMLGKMLSTVSVASYNPAIRVSNLVEIPTLTIANLVFPKMAQYYRSNDHTQSNQLYERSVSLLLSFMLPLSIIMFLWSDQIVYLIAGKNYIDSGYLLKITACYTLFIPFGRQFGILLDSARKPHVNFYVVLTTAIVGSLITFVFIKNWGITGAAFGTLTTYFLRFVFQQWWLYTYFGVSTGAVFRAVPGVYIGIFKYIFKNGS